MLGGWWQEKTSCALTRFPESEVNFFHVFQHTGSSHCWHSTTEVNTHCSILCRNCSTPSDKKSICQQHQTVGTSKTLLLFDHASAHKAKATGTFLKEQNIQVLAQCDFWLFPLIREKLAGWKFSCSQDPTEAVNSELHALSPSNYQNAFEYWCAWLELCVQSRGE